MQISNCIGQIVGGGILPGMGASHAALMGLGADDHTQYALLAGRSGGQILNGSPDTGENLVLRSNAILDGSIQFQDWAAFYFAGAAPGNLVINGLVPWNAGSQVNIDDNDGVGTAQIAMRQQGAGNLSILLNHTETATLGFVQNYTIGVDGGDSKAFKISASNGFAGAPAFIYRTVGGIVELRSRFAVYDGSTDAIVMGDSITVFDANSMVNIRANNSNAVPILTLDQDGTGDNGVSFTLTGLGGFTIGQDQSEGGADKLFFSTNNVLGAATNFMVIDKSGSFAMLGIGKPDPEVRVDIARAVDGDADLLLLHNDEAEAAASTNEAVRIRFGFGSFTDVGRIVVGKVADYTSGANRQSFMEFQTENNAVKTTVIRIETGDSIGFYGVNPVTQAAKINDPAGGVVIDAEARAAINAILDAIEGIGISAAA